MSEQRAILLAVSSEGGSVAHKHPERKSGVHGAGQRGTLQRPLSKTHPNGKRTVFIIRNCRMKSVAMVTARV